MTATALRTAPDVVDVVALGESMVTFLPSRPGRLADVPSFERGIGGAESNVACVLAAAGHSVRWVSRVGADGFGDHLVEAIGAYGVDVSSVRRDPARPTGVYFRTAGDRAGDGHEVAYYRAGSAASAMGVGNVEMGAARAARVLHLSGITAALSEDCLALLRELTAPAAGRPLVSFDVNHRQELWREADGAPILLELARDADIVFLGEDEAEEAWGVTGGPETIRELLPEPGTLVVKQGAEGATVFERRPGRGGRPAAGRGEPVAQFPAPLGSARPGRVVERAPYVSVVAPVGAGDAFAAGFLSGTLRGLPLRDRLRHGHLMAAAALTVPGDLATPPSRDHADRLAALDDDAWGRLRLGPGWTHAVDRAPEEVRTP
ncbi:sugar kinase [Streptomyces sp. TRM70350]|uniref:sugar kinase n=1 Tax=Streptomyces sp. TRM70350 TaxID=2856165 RepID=UPI001C48E4AE|nr:sugar kinase [Streptomyces sp. TRM70350]MBV7699947.1 sugar kinase [Streptomyces sp. TRM70350]